MLTRIIPKVLRAPRCPRRDGGALRRTQEVEMASAWEGGLPTTTVEGILEVTVRRVCPMRIILRAERGGIVELHVGQHRGQGTGEGQESEFHVCR